MTAASFNPIRFTLPQCEAPWMPYQSKRKCVRRYVTSRAVSFGEIGRSDRVMVRERSADRKSGPPMPKRSSKTRVTITGRLEPMVIQNQRFHKGSSVNPTGNSVAPSIFSSIPDITWKSAAASSTYGKPRSSSFHRCLPRERSSNRSPARAVCSQIPKVAASCGLPCF